MLFPLRMRPRFAGPYLVLLLVAALSAGCGDSPTEPDDDDFSITFSDLVLGDGAIASAGRIVTVHYTGWIADATQPDKKGAQFETSVGGTPFSFLLGFGFVIPGWDLGIPTMRVGGVRRIEIPPALAYGSTGRGSIPPNATLIFDIQLLAVQ